MIDERVARARKDYETRGLRRADMAADPFQEFESWYGEADDAGVIQANAFVLSTATPEGRPSARAVLMKGFDDRGLVFYSNASSRKGAELAANPFAAGTFVWIPIHRQVRFEGSVEQVSPEEADRYFASRPPGARVAAVISPQSHVIESRRVLEDEFARAQREEGESVSRPAEWLGWRLRPDAVEFWQGRQNRLHDRFRYRRAGGLWEMDRLAP